MYIYVYNMNRAALYDQESSRSSEKKDHVSLVSHFIQHLMSLEMYLGDFTFCW